MFFFFTLISGIRILLKKFKFSITSTEQRQEAGRLLVFLGKYLDWWWNYRQLVAVFFFCFLLLTKQGVREVSTNHFSNGSKIVRVNCVVVYTDLCDFLDLNPYTGNSIKYNKCLSHKCKTHDFDLFNENPRGKKNLN